MTAEPPIWPAWPPSSTPSPAPAEYNAFARSLQIVSVRFAKASVEAPAIFIANPTRRLRSSSTRGAKYLNFSNGFAATLEFSFRGWWEDEPTTGVTAAAEVEVLYRSPAPMTDAIFHLFRDRQLAVHSWPYLREFLHSSLGRTGWPVHTLPPFPRPPKAAAPPPSTGLSG